jgi:hypothetical protein
MVRCALPISLQHVACSAKWISVLAEGRRSPRAGWRQLGNRQRRPTGSESRCRGELLVTVARGRLNCREKTCSPTSCFLSSRIGSRQIKLWDRGKSSYDSLMHDQEMRECRTAGVNPCRPHYRLPKEQPSTWLSQTVRLPFNIIYVVYCSFFLKYYSLEIIFTNKCIIG